MGDDGNGRQIGVAPGAQWIGCRNMEDGWGTPATYMECFEFFLAPYPVGGDPFSDGEPSLAPHVINNSWTCPPSEGCDVDTLQATVENVRAAGIMVVASAGNDGSSCGTVEDPPAIYDAAFSVGATSSSDNIASFSSRGPVTADGSGRLKPDVSAPGVSVRSCVPGGGYSSMQGTSMAGPHVAGTAALVWSAVPSLIGDVDATEALIAGTARPRTSTQGCGGDGGDDVPNNVYGWGIVDALAAMPEMWVSSAGQAQILDGFPVRGVVYTVTMTNLAPVSLTQVTISYTLPASTTLLWVEEPVAYDATTGEWENATLLPGATLSWSLGVALDVPLPGSQLVNQIQMYADGGQVPLGGLQIDVTIPWQVILLHILKGGVSRGM